MTSLISERALVLASAEQIIAAAQAVHRDLTVGEVNQVNLKIAQVDAIDAKIKAARVPPNALDELNAAYGPPPGVVLPINDGTSPLSVGLKSLHEAARSGRSISVDLPRKDFVAYTLPPMAMPGLVGGDYPGASPRLLDLFTQANAPGPTVRIFKISTPGTAEQVSEGRAKPDAGLAVTPQDIAMVKIATTCKVSDEVSEDAPTFITALRQELGQAILTAENDYAVDVILGSGLGTDSAANAVDGVADAIATLHAVGVQADAVAMNPSDLATLRKIKSESAGEYVVDPLSNAPVQLHGLPITVTNGLDEGSVLIGSFRTAGTAFTRDALRVDVGLDGTDFTYNLRTLRAEERLALGIVRPLHMIVLSLTES